MSCGPKPPDNAADEIVTVADAPDNSADRIVTGIDDGGGSPGDPPAFQDSVSLAGSETVVTQGSGLVHCEVGHVYAATMATDDDGWKVALLNVRFDFGGGTAGEAGQPIHLALKDLLGSIDELASGFDAGFGVPAVWRGIIGGEPAGGVLAAATALEFLDAALLRDSAQALILDGLIDDDAIAFHASWLVAAD